MGVVAVDDRGLRHDVDRPGGQHPRRVGVAEGGVVGVVEVVAHLLLAERRGQWFLVLQATDDLRQGSSSEIRMR